MASAEIENDHFRRIVQHTLAGGNIIGKITSRASAKILVLTHHRLLRKPIGVNGWDQQQIPKSSD